MNRPERRFTLRTQVAVVLAVIVAVAMTLSACICFVAMRSSLRGEVDGVLRDQGRAMSRVQPAKVSTAQVQAGLDALSKQTGHDGASAFQVILGDGHSAISAKDWPGFQVTDADREVIGRGARAAAHSDRTGAGQHFRVITVALPSTSFRGLQIGRSLSGVDHDLHDLGWTLALVGFASTALAAFAAWLLTRPVVAPTEQALAGSLAAQSRLVADASHELRTPITSMRTNAELLTRHASLDPATRDQIARELVQQSEGLADLVTDLLDLAKDPGTLTLGPTRFDELTLDAIADLQAAHPEVSVTERVSPCLVKGARPELARVLRNLLENAAIHGAPADGSPARVHVELATDGTLTVRDWGTGVARAEVPRLFDRFARGEASRGRPGSGLGLAIVKQIVEAHDGSVGLHAATDGPGTVAEVRIPTMANVAHRAAEA
ncbi:MAG: HAMP domain-containing sensor histidine kinase [Patulibacter sp.]|nr:HAMP domain-containing sensor histidine kinase [Patulibacter sp.]